MPLELKWLEAGMLGISVPGTEMFVDSGIHRYSDVEVAEWPPLHRQVLQASAMYELLKELEWSITFFTTSGSCPSCDYGKNDGHAPDCRLAAVLKAVEGEERA